MRPTAIVDTLNTVLHLSPHAVLVKIGGGEVNEVYRLSDENSHWAVKYAAKDSFNGVNSHTQYALQKQLAHCGIAPEPVFLSQDGTLWVENWVQPKDISKTALSTLARALALIHNQQVDAEPLGLSLRWEKHMALASTKENASLMRRARQFIDQDLLCDSPADAVLCHNDLSWEHIICANPLIMVDWEYAAIGNRYFDLAGCALINRFSREQQHQLCEYYAKIIQRPLPEVLQQFKHQQKVVAITNELWMAAVQSRAGGEAET